MSYPQDISPLPWSIEDRIGHSMDYEPRPVIVDANGVRVAIISVNGSPKGDYGKAMKNARHLCKSANESWDIIHD